jgi:hypothetical protein
MLLGRRRIARGRISWLRRIAWRRVPCRRISGGRIPWLRRIPWWRIPWRRIAGSVGRRLRRLIGLLLDRASAMGTINRSEGHRVSAIFTFRGIHRVPNKMAS